MTRSRTTRLLVVLAAVAAALTYRLSAQPAKPVASPSLAPLIARAALEPCIGEVASREGKGALPAVHLACLDGTGSRDLLFSQSRTQLPTLVNIYGSWCAPCVREMPVLRQLHDLTKDRVRLVGIDTEDDPRLGLLFAIDLHQNWPALRDDDGLVSRALGGGAPKTVFVDAAGKVVFVERGGYTSLAVLRADVQRYLKVTV